MQRIRHVLRSRFRPPALRWGATVVAAAVFGLAAFGAGPASAAECRQVGPYKVCGGVFNYTDLSMRIAKLQGSSACRVFDPILPWLSRTRGCTWTILGPGRRSSSVSGYRDTDAFRFHSDRQAFVYNDRLILGRTYVKVRVGAICARRQGPLPRCFGF